MTQTEAIRRHLEAGLAIDGLTALKRYGCFRLPARVAELREAGLTIRADMVSRNGKRYARYRLEAPPCPACEGTGYVKAHPLQHSSDPAIPYCGLCKGDGHL